MIIIGFIGLAVIGATIRWRVSSVAGPWGTASVNGVGALLLGLLVGSDPSDGVLTVFGTAAIGALTTVSGWVNEVAGLWKTGQRSSALTLVAATVALCVAAAWVGLQLST